MDITPSEIKEWIEILGTPSLAVVGFIVVILYRELLIHFGKGLVDICVSWLVKR